MTREPVALRFPTIGGEATLVLGPELVQVNRHESVQPRGRLVYGLTVVFLGVDGAFQFTFDHRGKRDAVYSALLLHSGVSPEGIRDVLTEPL